MDAAQPLITYAQNREDLYLWALLAHRTPGTYVDVGCYQERLHSVTRLFYERGWSGLNIDANTRFASQYRCRTRDRFVGAAIGATAGELVFRQYPNHDGLSTFDEVLKAEHLGAGYGYKDVTVPVRTLDDVLSAAGLDHIDFLKIDVEGFEPDVLRGLDLTKTRPTVVVIEASREEACQAILLPHRYHREFFDGLNTYYVDDDAHDVTIYNYAGRVLQQDVRTDREEHLNQRLTQLQSDARPLRTRLRRFRLGDIRKRATEAWYRCRARVVRRMTRDG